MPPKISTESGDPPGLAPIGIPRTSKPSPLQLLLRKPNNPCCCCTPGSPKTFTVLWRCQPHQEEQVSDRKKPCCESATEKSFFSWHQGNVWGPSAGWVMLVTLQEGVQGSGCCWETGRRVSPWCLALSLGNNNAVVPLLVCCSHTFTPSHGHAKDTSVPCSTQRCQNFSNYLRMLQCRAVVGLPAPTQRLHGYTSTTLCLCGYILHKDHCHNSPRGGGLLAQVYHCGAWLSSVHKIDKRKPDNLSLLPKNTLKLQVSPSVRS